MKVALIFVFCCLFYYETTAQFSELDGGGVSFGSAGGKTRLKVPESKIVIIFKLSHECAGIFTYCYSAAPAIQQGTCPAGMCMIEGRLTENTLHIKDAEQSTYLESIDLELSTVTDTRITSLSSFTLIRDVCNVDFKDGEVDFQVVHQSMKCEPVIKAATIVEKPKDTTKSAGIGIVAIICIIVGILIVIVVAIVVSVVLYRKRAAKKTKRPIRQIQEESSGTKEAVAPMQASKVYQPQLQPQPMPQPPAPVPATSSGPQVPSSQGSNPVQDTQQNQKSRHSVNAPVAVPSTHLPVSVQKASGAVTSRQKTTDDSHEDVSVSERGGVTPLKTRPIRQNRASKRDSYREVIEEVEDVFESLERWKMITKKQKILLKAKYPLKTVKCIDKREIFLFIESLPLAIKILLRLMNEADLTFTDMGYIKGKSAPNQVLACANDPTASAFLQMRMIALEEYKIFDSLPRVLDAPVKRLSIQAKFVYLLLECHDKEFRGQLLLNIKAHAFAQLGPMPPSKKQSSLYPLRVIVEANYIVNDANEKGLTVPTWKSEKTKSKSMSGKNLS